MSRYALGLAALALGVAAQTTPYTDASSGITFAAFTDPTTKTQVGLALPKTPSTDFIGQIIGASNNASGWTGLDLGPGMTDKLLIVAWPSGEDVMASFRYATAYSAPGVYTAANVTMYPIEKGTFVNATHYQYTFLCQGCIGDATLSFNPSTSNSTGLGWAHSTEPLSDPTDTATELTFHAAGDGSLAVTLADAESANYAAWAALASTTPMGGASSNSSTGSGPAGAGSYSIASTGNTAGAASPTGVVSAGSGSSPVYPTGTAVAGGVSAASTGFLASPTGVVGASATSTGNTGSNAGASGNEGRRGHRGHFRPRPHRHEFRPEPNTRSALKPESAKEDDGAKWKASFLDGYYKAK